MGYSSWVCQLHSVTWCDWAPSLHSSCQSQPHGERQEQQLGTSGRGHCFPGGETEDKGRHLQGEGVTRAVQGSKPLHCVSPSPISRYGSSLSRKTVMKLHGAERVAGLWREGDVGVWARENPHSFSPPAIPWQYTHIPPLSPMYCSPSLPLLPRQCALFGNLKYDNPTGAE